MKAIANVSQLIYKEKGILNFTVCLKRIWITVCYLAVFMNIQYWIWRRLSIFCRCIIQIISIFRAFICNSCCMNIFNRYMTLYVNWISLLCPDITYCLYHLGNADWIMCKVDIDTVSNKISCRHKLIYNILLTRDQSGLKNRSVIPSEHGFCLLNVQLSNFSRQGSIYLGTVHCLRHNLLLEWYFWGFCFAK